MAGQGTADFIPATSPLKYFFISRAGADREAGKLIGGWLEEAGHRVFIQDWDIESGQNFLMQIHDALAAGAHVIALLSDPYFASDYCKQEWTAAIKAQQDTGTPRLTPLRVTNCTPNGLLAAVTYIDLVGFDAQSARRTVLAAADAIGGLPRTGGSWLIPAPLDKPRLTNLEAFDEEAFTGREEELKFIHDSLTSEEARRVTVTALAGLGGVGKSALALAYCARHMKDYEVIWWVRAESEQDIETDLAKLAIEWNPAHRNLASRQEQALEAIRIASTWSASRPFLIVFDNASAPSSVRPFRPTGKCRIIVTSRNVSWGREWRQMTVRKLDPDSAAKLLMNATGRRDYEGARALAKELDGLALPLTHAAAFLRENSAISFLDFIRRFDEFMQWQTEDADVRTTYATYSIAIAKVSEPRPAAETVMSVAAYCAPNSIPVSFIETALRITAKGTVEAANDNTDRVKDAISALGRYGLVDIETNATPRMSVSLHRVLQRVVRKIHADRNETELWGCTALRAIEQNAADFLDETTRHGQEALDIVPEDICRGTRAALQTIISDRFLSAGQAQIGTEAIVARPREIERIHLLLSERGQRAVVLVGVGGIGKTTMARLYADQFRRSYEDVWWISAASEELIASGLIEASRRAGARDTYETKESARREVWNFAANLSRRRPLLIIYDDVDSPKTVARWLPEEGNIRLLITSRFADWGRSFATISIGSLPPDEAVRFFLQRSGRPELEEARQIAELLDGNPFALSQAASLLQKNEGLSVTDLLHQIRGVASAHDGDGQQTIGLVLRQRIGRLRREHPAADSLLSLVAFCGAEQIPKEIIVAACTSNPVALHGLNNHMNLDEAIAVLAYEGLLKNTTDDIGISFSAHSLVLEVKRAALSTEDQELFGAAALAGATAAFPNLNDPTTWVRAERIAIQGLAIDGLAPPGNPELRARLLAAIGELRLRQGEYDSAEPPLRRALDINRNHDRLGVGSNLASLSDLYRLQGHYAEAEPLLREAIHIFEEELGAEHSDVAAALNNLAQLQRLQGHLDGAEQLMRRALALKERSLGPDHPEQGASLANLAALYRQQGRYAEAEPLYRRAVSIYERALGPDHPDVGQSLNNLAVLYQDQGRYADAEVYFERSLAIYERVLGPDHPDAATGLNNLASLYRRQGRDADAEPLLRRALGISEQSLGPEHPVVGTTLNNLGQLYSMQGRHAEAEPLFQRSLWIREKAFGPEHPEVAETLNAIAQSYSRQARFSEAEPMLRRVLEMRERMLGSRHPDVAETLSALAQLYGDQGRYGEAGPALERSLAIRREILDPEHPVVADTLTNLAQIHRNLGRSAEAKKCWAQALSIYEGQFGADQIRARAVRQQLADLQSLDLTPSIPGRPWILMLATLVLFGVLGFASFMWLKYGSGEPLSRIFR